MFNLFSSNFSHRAYIPHSISSLTENGRKNTAAKQLTSMAAFCGYHISESYLKRRTKSGGLRPHFIRAHIQLSGHDLTNNHILKLLSGLLWQTLYTKNITSELPCVNPKTHLRQSEIDVLFLLPGFVGLAFLSFLCYHTGKEREKHEN